MVLVGQEKIDEEKRLYSIVNPVTGFRYDIPMLKESDPDYRRMYIEHMRVKETNPEKFERVLQWA